MSIRQNLWKDDITQLEMRPVISVSPECSLRDAIEVMRESRAGGLLICEADKLVGIFTDRDYVKRVLALGVDLDEPIRAYMTPQPVTVRLNEQIGVVIRTMFQGHYRHLPVLDDEGRPKGTVSVKGIVQYLVDHFPSAVYNLPPQPRQLQTAREGA